VPAATGSTTYGPGQNGQVLKTNGTTVYWDTVAWGNIANKPSTFTPSTHTHNHITSQGANVANTRGPAYAQSLVTGGWASNDAGYGSTYGTTLDVSGYSTWYHRLAFHTNGQIDYWQGINTNTLTKVGGILTSANTSFTRSLTSGTKIGTIKINGTSTDIYCQTNTDSKVAQTPATANTFRPIVLGAKNGAAGAAVLAEETTAGVHTTTKLYANAATGALYATTFVGDLTGTASLASALTNIIESDKASNTAT
jgi:hypothetical protein